MTNETVQASMGPRVRTRGDATVASNVAALVASLQWGRAFARAEITPSKVKVMHVTVASMGPRVRTRGDPTGMEHVAGVPVASMGPRVRTRGDGQAGTTRGELFLLQWGRAFARAEIVDGEPDVHDTSRASMGPRVRTRGDQLARAQQRLVARLQWGRAFARAEIGKM